MVDFFYSSDGINWKENTNIEIKNDIPIKLNYKFNAIDQDNIIYSLESDNGIQRIKIISNFTSKNPDITYINIIQNPSIIYNVINVHYNKDISVINNSNYSNTITTFFKSSFYTKNSDIYCNSYSIYNNTIYVMPDVDDTNLRYLVTNESISSLYSFNSELDYSKLIIKGAALVSNKYYFLFNNINNDIGHSIINVYDDSHNFIKTIILKEESDYLRQCGSYVIGNNFTYNTDTDTLTNLPIYNLRNNRNGEVFKDRIFYSNYFGTEPNKDKNLAFYEELINNKIESFNFFSKDNNTFNKLWIYSTNRNYIVQNNIYYFNFINKIIAYNTIDNTMYTVLDSVNFIHDFTINNNMLIYSSNIKALTKNVYFYDINKKILLKTIKNCYNVNFTNNGRAFHITHDNKVYELFYNKTEELITTIQNTKYLQFHNNNSHKVDNGIYIGNMYIDVNSNTITELIRFPTNIEVIKEIYYINDSGSIYVLITGIDNFIELYKLNSHNVMSLTTGFSLNYDSNTVLDIIYATCRNDSLYIQKYINENDTHKELHIDTGIYTNSRFKTKEYSIYVPNINYYFYHKNIFNNFEIKFNIKEQMASIIIIDENLNSKDITFPLFSINNNLNFSYFDSDIENFQVFTNNILVKTNNNKLYNISKYNSESIYNTIAEIPMDSGLYIERFISDNHNNIYGMGVHSSSELYRNFICKPIEYNNKLYSIVKNGDNSTVIEFDPALSSNNIKTIGIQIEDDIEKLIKVLLIDSKLYAIFNNAIYIYNLSTEESNKVVSTISDDIKIIDAMSFGSIIYLLLSRYNNRIYRFDVSTNTYFETTVPTMRNYDYSIGIRFGTYIYQFLNTTNPQNTGVLTIYTDNSDANRIIAFTSIDNTNCYNTGEQTLTNIVGSLFVVKIIYRYKIIIMPANGFRNILLYDLNNLDMSVIDTLPFDFNCTKVEIFNDGTDGNDINIDVYDANNTSHVINISSNNGDIRVKIKDIFPELNLTSLNNINKINNFSHIGTNSVGNSYLLLDKNKIIYLDDNGKKVFDPFDLFQDSDKTIIFSKEYFFVEYGDHDLFWFPKDSTRFFSIINYNTITNEFSLIENTNNEFCKVKLNLTTNEFDMNNIVPISLIGKNIDYTSNEVFEYFIIHSYYIEPVIRNEPSNNYYYLEFKLNSQYSSMYDRINNIQENIKVSNLIMYTPYFLKNTVQNVIYIIDSNNKSIYRHTISFNNDELLIDDEISNARIVDIIYDDVDNSYYLLIQKSDGP